MRIYEKRKLRQTVRVSKTEHDNGLVACTRYRHELTDAEFLDINEVCAAWAANEPVDMDIFTRARKAVYRIMERTRQAAHA